MPEPPPDPPEVLARIHEGLPLVDQLARRMRRDVGSAATEDELVAYGREGLLGAARTYDASKGVPFRSWAQLRARGAMIDGVRANGQLPRRLYRRLRALEASEHVHAAWVEEARATPAAGADAADARLGSYLASVATAMAARFVTGSAEEVDEGDTPEERLARAELAARVRGAIERLPEKERRLLHAHYFEDRTLEEAAATLGLSKSWGSRLHARAVQAVAERLRAEGIGEPR